MLLGHPLPPMAIGTSVAWAEPSLAPAALLHGHVGQGIFCRIMAVPYLSVAMSTPSLPPIPAKRYFTIGEVAELCGVKPHVLRYWEQEFTQLSPMKRRGNRRYYQHHEVLMVRRIRALLYEQGFTINGARHQLDGCRGASATPASPQDNQAALQPSSVPSACAPAASFAAPQSVHAVFPLADHAGSPLSGHVVTLSQVVQELRAIRDLLA